MSKISAFISSLRDSFTKTDIKDEARALREASKEVASIYKSLADTMGKNNLMSTTAKDYDAAFKKYVKGSKNQNIFVGLAAIFAKLDDKVSAMERLLSEDTKSDIVREAISALEVNIIRFLETINFIVVYGSRLATTLTICETNVANKLEELDSITVAEAEYIAKNGPNFWDSINTITPDARAIEHSFKSIPDIMLNKDNADAMSSLVGRDKVDPMRMGFIPVQWNPMYHINMAYAEWQANRFDKIVEDRNMVQFKLQQFKMAASGTKNPQLERKIQACQERLDKLNYSIAKKVEAYGLDGNQYV